MTGLVQSLPAGWALREPPLAPLPAPRQHECPPRARLVFLTSCYTLAPPPSPWSTSVLPGWAHPSPRQLQSTCSSPRTGLQLAGLSTHSGQDASHGRRTWTCWDKGMGEATSRTWGPLGGRKDQGLQGAELRMGKPYRGGGERDRRTRGATWVPPAAAPGLACRSLALTAANGKDSRCL